MAKDNYQLGDINITGAPVRGQGGGRMKAAEKPKSFSGAWKKIISYCRKYVVWLIIAFSFAAISTVLTLFGPNRLSEITDMISAYISGSDIDLNEIWHIGIYMTIFYVASGLLTYAQNFTLAQVTHKIMYEMREDIQAKLGRIPLSRYDSTSFGDLLSRLTNDVDTIAMSINNALGQLVSGIFMFIGCGFMMLYTNWILGLVALGISLLGFFINQYLINYSQKYFSLRQRYLGEINGHIEEMYAGHVIVKAFNGEDDAKQEFNRLNKLLYDNNLSSQFLSGIRQPLMELIGNFAYIAVCVVGALLVLNGSITFGVVVAFIVYVKLFTQPLGQVAQSTIDLQSAAAAAERVFAFLDEEEMEDESYKTAQLTNCKGDIVFDHVKFGYSPDRVIIHDFSQHFYPGEKIAIVGHTGAGKTTLVNLLMRFYEIDDGKITIDGISTQDITRENVHDLFCMVLQDTWLFNGTVKENLVFNMKDISDEEVVKVCKAVGLHRHIMTLPQGYDTVLTDDSNMSSGQRQLLTIARAMLNKAPLLILDEATSSVDTRTEQIVQSAMDKLTEGRTSFTIAHRLSTIRSADKILVMKDGDIVETGKHEELLEKGGVYASLWQSQFVNAETI